MKFILHRNTFYNIEKMESIKFTQKPAYPHEVICRISMPTGDTSSFILLIEKDKENDSEKLIEYLTKEFLEFLKTPEDRVFEIIEKRWKKKS